jgi:hypothetical protein
VKLDAAGLFAAGLINTFIALFVAGVVFGPGTEALESDMLDRAAWIAEHPLRWQGGWMFWFVVTLSFAWSYYALGRHLSGIHPWSGLAIGLAIIAAAVDLVGVIVNIVVLPQMAQSLAEATRQDSTLLVLFGSLEELAYTLVSVSAFGLYSLAGLLLLPAVFATDDYPRRLAWLGVAEWTMAALASTLLIVVADLAPGFLIISFALYAPWVWGNGIWLLRRESVTTMTRPQDAGVGS